MYLNQWDGKKIANWCTYREGLARTGQTDCGKKTMNDIVAARCALKELASYLHANGRQLRSSFPNPPVYNDNPRNTSFRGMMDNGQIVITHPTNFCHGSWSETSVTQRGILLSPGKKLYLVIFRDQVTRDHKYLTHKDTYSSTFQDCRRLRTQVAIH